MFHNYQHTLAFINRILCLNLNFLNSLISWIKYCLLYKLYDEFLLHLLLILWPKVWTLCICFLCDKKNFKTSYLTFDSIPQNENPETFGESVEVVMIQLRKMCDLKQREHIHVQDGSRVGRTDVRLFLLLHLLEWIGIILGCYSTLLPVLGNTLLEIAGIVLPLLSSLLILYSRELLLYSIFYSETRYSTRILLKSIEKF